MSVPDALHCGMADASVFGHGAGGPVGGLLGRGVQGVFDDALDGALGVLAFSASPGAVDEAIEALLSEAASPFTDRVLTRLQLLGDVETVESRRGQQDDACPKDITNRRAARAIYNLFA